MIEFRPPEPVTLLLEDQSGNYAAVTSVAVEARRLLPGRTTLRGDECVAFTFTVSTVVPGTGWLGGWRATHPITALEFGGYIATAVLTFPAGVERVDCPFEITA